jgi:DNA polymerase III sliding clamp (beta) subunit (PCNA family)
MEEDLPDIKLVAGKEREFGFNGAYLSDMILALANPDGLIGEPDQSVLFHDQGAKYLLMPVSLPG